MDHPTAETDAGKAGLPRRGVGGLVARCERAFYAELERRMRPHGITPSQWMHLSELYAQDGLTQVELSGRLGIEKASSTRVLSDLRARGLIERRVIQDDRRKFANRLTRKGRDLTTRLIREAVALTARSQRGLDPDDVRIFLKVLATITRNLQPR